MEPAPSSEVLVNLCACLSFTHGTLWQITSPKWLFHAFTGLPKANMINNGDGACLLQSGFIPGNHNAVLPAVAPTDDVLGIDSSRHIAFVPPLPLESHAILLELPTVVKGLVEIVTKGKPTLMDSQQFRKNVRCADKVCLHMNTLPVADG